MRNPLFETKAPKQTVSITLNSDLYAKAKAIGINASGVAEEALARAYAERCKQTQAVELELDVAAVDSYSAEHGSFGELARAHYERDDGAV